MKKLCCISQLKYLFRLEENVSRANTTHQLPKETITWTLHSHVIRSCFLKPLQICELPGIKQNISSQLFSSFELRSITKHWVLFPVDLKVSLGETLRVSGKQKSLFPLGPVIKCLLTWKSSADVLACKNKHEYICERHSNLLLIAFESKLSRRSLLKPFGSFNWIGLVLGQALYSHI